MKRRNRNRVYMNLRVWQDSVNYYRETWLIFEGFRFELKRIVSQQMACVDSIQRNIAEGSCRKSIREYLNFLNIAKSSLGESVSSLCTYLAGGHISPEQFEHLDGIAYKIENALINLITSLEHKRDSGDWNDQLTLKEDAVVYTIPSQSINPTIH